MGLFTTGGGGGGGVLFKCEAYNASKPSLFGETFVGLHILLRVRISYFACGFFITRADFVSRVRILI